MIANVHSNNPEVVCLFEESGLSARAWAEAGYNVFCYDILHEIPRVESVGRGLMIFQPWDARDRKQVEDLIKRHKGRAVIVLSYPPCTDLAVSGAAWFAGKLERDPLYRKKAMDLVYVGWEIGLRLDVAFCIENPVSVISSEWRKPDVIFNPSDYGGYLPEDDVHPLYPEYIEPRDAYPKKTCYWYGNGFVMPPKDPVPRAAGYSKQHLKLGGKTPRVKRIRSASPRGIARATFIFNQPKKGAT